MNSHMQNDVLRDVLGWTDTRKEPNGEVIPGIGVIHDGVLETHHVTDDPAAVLRAIRQKRNLIAAYGLKGKNAELGPGLYFSGVPDFWIGRSREKYSFLENLTRAQMQELTHKLDRDVSDMVWNRYITMSEADDARDVVFGVMDGERKPSALVMLAGQPYNIAFWKDSFLSPLGIRSSTEPGLVTVGVRGLFARVCCDYLPAAEYRALRRMGAVGVYKTPTMTVNPELVLWDVKAIVNASSDRLRR